MEQALLEAAKKFLAEHYAARLTAEGKPTQAAAVAGLAQCLVNSPDFAKLQLENEVLKLHYNIVEKDLFKQLAWLDRAGVKYDWGRLEGHLYVLTQEAPKPLRKK